jgi:hypothetical protein
MAIKDLPESEQTSITSALERIVALMEIGHIEAAPILARESKLPSERKDS